MVNRFEHFASSISCIYRYIQKIERDEMEKHGLKGPHAMCIVIISRYEEGLTSSELCKVCDKDKAAISRTIAQLVNKGIVERRCVNGINYRSKLVLTEKGAEIANTVNELVKAAVDKAVDGISDEEREAFYTALDLYATNLQNMAIKGLN